MADPFFSFPNPPSLIQSDFRTLIFKNRGLAIETGVLGLSIVLQFAAAYLALRLIYITGNRIPWILISLAIILMGIRRSISLYRLATSDLPQPTDLTAEFVALTISALMVAGLYLIGPVFRSHRRAESDLWKTQERYRILLGNLSGMAYRCRNDPDWTMEYVSEGAEDLTGYPVSDLLNNARVSYSNLIHPDDQDWLWKKCQISLEVREPCRNEYRILTADKGEKWVLDLARGSYSDKGELLYIEGFITDVTGKKRDEEALRRSEEKYRMIIGNISEIVYRARFAGDSTRDVEIDFVSPQTEKITGYRPEEFQMEPGLWFKILEREDVPLVTESTRKLIQTGEPVVRSYRLLHKTSAESHWIEDKATPIKDPSGKVIGIMGVARDITERKKLEEELQHAGKLEAIGQLAGGIAHEFNNLLTSIIGHLELARNEAGKKSGMAPLLVTAEQAAHKGVGLTQQLLTFSRRKPVALEPVDLGSISEEVLKLLRLTIDRRINIRVKKAEDLWPVQADPNQMNQVIMNLCVNSRDSLVERMDLEKDEDINGGWEPKISIQVKNVSLGPEQVGSNTSVKPGDFVCLSVTDNGMGIDKKTRTRVFEPFFTTKPIGIGTGLGLATVHGIVQKHHGWMDLESVVHGTTTFSVYLARTAGQPLPSPSLPEDQPVPGGSELILFVDDEPGIRRLGKAILEQLGYRVLLASDGEEALALYDREKAGIGLVVLDMTMPGRSGLDVLRKIRDTKPTAKVIISSGNLQPEGTPGLVIPGLVQHVPKPYHPEELARGVRNLLDFPVPE